MPQVHTRCWGDGTDPTTCLKVPSGDLPMVITELRQQATVWGETKPSMGALGLKSVESLESHRIQNFYRAVVQGNRDVPATR